MGRRICKGLLIYLRVLQKYWNRDEAKRSGADKGSYIQSMILERSNRSCRLPRILQGVDYIMDDTGSYSRPICKYGYEDWMRHCFVSAMRTHISNSWFIQTILLASVFLCFLTNLYFINIRFIYEFWNKYI